MEYEAPEIIDFGSIDEVTKGESIGTDDTPVGEAVAGS